MKYNIMDDYDPYNCMEDLAPIVSLISMKVDEKFHIPCIHNSYGYDMMENMRYYVNKHYQTVLDFTK